VSHSPHTTHSHTTPPHHMTAHRPPHSPAPPGEATLHHTSAHPQNNMIIDLRESVVLGLGPPSGEGGQRPRPHSQPAAGSHDQPVMGSVFVI